MQSIHRQDMEDEMNFFIRLHKLLVLVVLVLISSACGTLRAPEPTIDVSEIQTSVYLTVLVEVTLTAPVLASTPIFTIEPTSTDVTQADYPRVVTSRFQTLQEAFVELIEIHNQLTANPNMSRNMDWYSQAVAALVRVTNGATEIAHMKNYPPEYAAFHQEMQSMAGEGNLLFSNYMVALDNQDLNAQNQATTNLSNMITSLNQAFAELNKLTPTETPAPTLIIFPTDTPIVFIPTSQPVAGSICAQRAKHAHVFCVPS